MRNRISILILLTFLIFLSSCEKITDEEVPRISISTPYNNQQINGNDTIFITGSVSDNNTIKSISISLRNSNDIPVLPTISHSPNDNSFSFNDPYFFDDLYMPSGQYYFSIKASDGINTATKYINISYGEIPKTRTGVFFYDNSGNTTSIYQLNGSSANLFKTVPTDFLGGAANSYGQQLITVGEYNAKILAYDVATGSQSWGLDFPNSSIPYYTNMFFHDKELYLGIRNGEIRAYNSNGSPTYFSNVQTSYYPENGLVHDNVFISEEKAIGNNTRYITTYWTNSGGFVHQLQLTEDIVGLYAYAPNNALFFANDNTTNDGKIFVYDASNNTKTTLFNLSPGTITSCEELGGGVFMIAQNGNLVLVNANNHSTLPYLNGINATKIKYDTFSNELYIVEGNTITAYDFSTKNVLFTYTHTSPVLDLVFLFNK
ncbi:MAG: Ig-like domain-containing protein [Flavobacteriales bacterium]|nr:Ig-like domain-containing protein [Flavobacteriales bacterium]